MAYTKTVWSDRVVDKPLTYTLQSNGDGTTTLIPAEGTIVQSGTPITAAALNNLETQYDSAVAYTDQEKVKYIRNGDGNNAGMQFDIVSGVFFTNGGSTNATATVTFGTAYLETPEIMPAQIDTVVSYGDVIYYPYMYNISATGFSCKLTAAGNLGTVGTPANLFMRFTILGRH